MAPLAGALIGSGPGQTVATARAPRSATDDVDQLRLEPAAPYSGPPLRSGFKRCNSRIRLSGQILRWL